MKFIYAEKTEKTPTFGDVEINQFFVDHDGYFCQKTSDSSLVVIANPNGDPYSTWFRNIDLDREIKRIIPLVEKIEF